MRSERGERGERDGEGGKMRGKRPEARGRVEITGSSLGRVMQAVKEGIELLGQWFVG